MIQTYISRSQEFDPVGAEPFEPEWAPATQDAIFDYFKWALDQMHALGRKAPELRDAIEAHIAGDLRNLLSADLLPTIDAFTREVVATRGHWYGGTKSIGDWLYFDRASPPDDLGTVVRALYDATLPTDPVEQVLLYSRFWQSDIHDPDKRYAEKPDDPDFNYSSRRAAALAPAIARDPALLDRVVTVMSSEDMKGPGAFVEALVPHLADPLATFATAVAVLDAADERDGMTFVRELLATIDRQLPDGSEEAKKLERIAESSAVLTKSKMSIHTALRVTDERLARLTAQVREGGIDVTEVVLISYGRALAGVSMDALGALIAALVNRDEEGGPWVALEILSMVTHETKALTPGLAPAIADGIEGNMSNVDYVHDRIMRLLVASGAIDDAFARAFALQIERACRISGARHGRPTDALRTALGTVVQIAPAEVWVSIPGVSESWRLRTSHLWISHQS